MVGMSSVVWGYGLAWLRPAMRLSYFVKCQGKEALWECEFCNKIIEFAANTMVSIATSVVFL